MILLRSINDLRDWRRSLAPGLRIGFTPTMGALHDGHLQHLYSLNPLVDLRVCSIYVNPTQFAPGEDLSSYPRDLERDVEMLEQTGCDILFFPDNQSMYPDGYSSYVVVEGVSRRYEGATRPDHFRGVATIVCKLLNLVQPDVISLGEKDAQQLALLGRMIKDLQIDTTILPIPTVRDADGLAKSSRNQYLSEGERSIALSISRALNGAREIFVATEDVELATQAFQDQIDPAIEVDYCAVVDRETFDQPTGLTEHYLGIFAGKVGATRLIDNMLLSG